MPSPKAKKIDLNAEYPCPCCRRGSIRPIALTEALGCDRCQQIFVLQDHGKAIEQLSTTYPYKRSWCWTGKRWIPNRSFPMRARNGNFALYLLLGVLVVVILLLVAALDLNSSWQLTVLTLAVIVLLILLFWFANQR